MGYLKNELAGFIPTPTANNIIKMTVRGSSILRLSQVTPMTSDKKKVPVFAGGAGAYWVGEGQRIQTTTAQWIFPELEAKKLAVIIPVTKEKLNDATIDVFAELESVIAEAFHTAIDSAALFGTSSPFATNLLKAATDNDHITTENGDIDLTISDIMAVVESSGFDVDGFAAKIGVKNSLRKLRDANGAPKFVDNNDGRTFYSQPIEFVRNNAWDDTKATMFAGEWRYSLVGMREDISYDILKEATLQNVLDSDGKPLSLAEQDMIGIRATMRLGYLVVKQEAFAALVPPAVTPSNIESGEPVVTPSATTTVEDALNAKTVVALREICDQRGIQVPSGALKPDIVALLLENGYVE